MVSFKSLCHNSKAEQQIPVWGLLLSFVRLIKHLNSAHFFFSDLQRWCPKDTLIHLTREFQQFTGLNIHTLHNDLPVILEEKKNHWNLILVLQEFFFTGNKLIKACVGWGLQVSTCGWVFGHGTRLDSKWWRGSTFQSLTIRSQVNEGSVQHFSGGWWPQQLNP